MHLGSSSLWNDPAAILNLLLNRELTEAGGTSATFAVVTVQVHMKKTKDTQFTKKKKQPTDRVTINTSRGETQRRA